MPYYGLEADTLQNTTQSLPLPVGTVVAFLSTSLPTGFIICDGRTIQNSAPLDPDYYPQLVEHLNPGNPTAVVPDLRGTFLRGYSIDSSVDPDGPRTPGDTQTDANKAHTHNVDWNYDADLSSGGAGASANAAGGVTYEIETTDETPAGATESRPKNTAVVWGIKASDTVTNSTIYNEADPNSLFANLTRSLKDQFNARLSTSATDCYASADDASVIYLTRCNGDSIWLYDIAKSIWSRYELPATSVTSISLTGYTDNRPYDIFVYDNVGTLTLESVIWTNVDTRATTLTDMDGVLVKNGEPNKRYVGTIVTKGEVLRCENGFGNGTGAETMVWGLFNKYNRQRIILSRTLSGVADVFPGTGDIRYNNDSSTFIGVCTGKNVGFHVRYNYSYTYRNSASETGYTIIRVASGTAVTTGSPSLGQQTIQNTVTATVSQGVIADSYGVDAGQAGLFTIGLTGYADAGTFELLALNMTLETEY